MAGGGRGGHVVFPHPDNEEAGRLLDDVGSTNANDDDNDDTPPPPPENNFPSVFSKRHNILHSQKLCTCLGQKYHLEWYFLMRPARTIDWRVGRRDVAKDEIGMLMEESA
jgi:hypothetical protein